MKRTNLVVGSLRKKLDLGRDRITEIDGAKRGGKMKMCRSEAKRNQQYPPKEAAIEERIYTRVRKIKRRMKSNKRERERDALPCPLPLIFSFFINSKISQIRNTIFKKKMDGVRVQQRSEGVARRCFIVFFFFLYLFYMEACTDIVWLFAVPF